MTLQEVTGPASCGAFLLRALHASEVSACYLKGQRSQTLSRLLVWQGVTPRIKRRQYWRLFCCRGRYAGRALRLPKQSVNEKISEIIKNGKDADSDIFRNFDRQLSVRRRCSGRDRTILDMYLRCHTHEAIAEAVGCDRVTVTEKIADIVENGKFSDSDIFRNFDRQLYTIWNFPKATNEVRHLLRL